MRIAGTVAVRRCGSRSTVSYCVPFVIGVLFVGILRFYPLTATAVVNGLEEDIGVVLRVRVRPLLVQCGEAALVAFRLRVELDRDVLGQVGWDAEADTDGERCDVLGEFLEGVVFGLCFPVRVLA
ncbi:hypothetical protein [Haloplanus litoreus]|uniref:Secreted protein n=1 Tax=Haloplanus litoreus TaxID=767515 RepID=A0ABD6A4K2_9EURY